MRKDQVIATILMEETSTPSKPINLSVINKPNLFYLNFTTVLQEFNVQNRNRRIYYLEPMWESLQLPHIQELIRKNTWCGEAGHPMSDETKRILTIDPKLISHTIKRIWLQGNLLYGEIETLDDGNGYGAKFTKNILQGQEPAFSLRALAQLIKTANGTSLVRTKSHIVTYDRVILPSHDKAYRDESVAIKTMYKEVALEGNCITGEERLIPVHEASLVDYIMEESMNVSIISDIMDVCKENVTFTPDLKSLVIKEGKETYLVNVEDKIKRDVMNCLIKL
jgi:uncharacterized Fe-S cluster protein YjdI